MPNNEEAWFKFDEEYPSSQISFADFYGNDTLFSRESEDIVLEPYDKFSGFSPSTPARISYGIIVDADGIRYRNLFDFINKNRYDEEKINSLWKDITRDLTEFETRILATVQGHDLSEAEQDQVITRLHASIDAVIQARATKPMPTEAPLLWRDRDKSLNQEPHEFIEATYFDAGIDVDRKTLRKLDRSLLTQLELQERDPERAPPQTFQDRFPRKSTQLDAEIAKIKETGERPDSYAERMRLIQAAKRRGTNLAKG